MSAKKDKHKHQSKARPGDHAVASSDPWARLPRGVALRQAIERGAGLDAVWMLQDGVVPEAEALGEALCSAAWQGQRELCQELLRKGAKAVPKALGAELSRSALDNSAWDPKFGPAAQALCGGHWPLAQELESRLGSKAYGEAFFSPECYAWLASRSKLAGASRDAGLARAREGMSSKSLSLAAALLACQGFAREAGELLDHLRSHPALPKVAEAMCAPLAAFIHGEAGRIDALTVLAKAVAICPRPGPGLALWESGDYAALSSWCETKPGERRLECFDKAADEGWEKAAREPGRWVWPRSAAALAQNQQALEILAEAPWSKEEAAALEALGRKALGDLQAAAQTSAKGWHRVDLPSSAWFGKPPPQEKHGRAPGSYDPIAAAHGALALAEAKAIEACSNEAAKVAAARQKREAKAARSRGEEAPAAPARRSSRL